MADKAAMIEIQERHAKFAEPLDTLCKFHIGQRVAAMDLMEGMRAELEMNGPTVVVKDTKISRYGGEQAINIPPMTVTSRWVEQCYGGIQVHYSVRVIGRDSKAEFRLSEYELMDWLAATAIRESHVVEQSRD